MVLITVRFLLIICLFFTAAYSECREPWLWPATYVDYGQDILEFQCGGYLRAGESLTWCGDGDKEKIYTHVEQMYDGYCTLDFNWPLSKLSSGAVVYCVKRIRLDNGTTVEARNELNPITFQTDNIKLFGGEMDLMLTPETFVDGGGPVVEFTCWAYLYAGDFLAWYQVQESNITSELLMMENKPSIGYVKLKLRKTVEPSDNGTRIYCATNVYKTGELKESKRIPLTFERQIEILKTPYVTVEPSSDKEFFDEGDELEFVCGGSEPVDGRALTWYLQDPEFKETTLPPGQIYHKSLNQNHLTLLLQVAYHRSKLYCAQDFTLILSNTTVRSYGERARSAMITLLHRGLNSLGAKSQQPWVWPVQYVNASKDIIEFTCGTYLRRDDRLSWHIGADKNITMSLNSGFSGFRILTLIWILKLMKSGDRIYCKKISSPGRGEGLEWRNELTPIYLDNYTITHTDEWGPWLMPETFVDDGGPVIEFTCWAYTRETDLLVWYQIQESNVTSMLAIGRVVSSYGYHKVKFRKTVEPSDNNTQVYCTAITPKGEKESQRITLIFKRQIKPLQMPYVTVEPSPDIVLFDEGNELEFVCGGSEPVDGRALTWYLQAPSVRHDMPPVQRYHRSSNQNHLTLLMEIAHHQSELYCAQDFTHELFNRTVKSYRERARSKTILVLLRGQCIPGDQPLVHPKKFVDNHKPFIQFTCYMFLQPGQILSWYQRSAHSDDILLQMVQLLDSENREGEHVLLTLNKTLEPSDNGSEIYCAKQNVLPNGSFSDMLKQTEAIPLTFTRDIPTLGESGTIVTVALLLVGMGFLAVAALVACCAVYRRRTKRPAPHQAPRTAPSAPSPAPHQAPRAVRYVCAPDQASTQVPHGDLGVPTALLPRRAETAGY